MRWWLPRKRGNRLLLTSAAAMRVLSRARSSATGRDLERAPLAARTKDAYGQHVRAYAAWLRGRGDSDDPLRDRRARITPPGTSNGTSRWIVLEARLGQPGARRCGSLQPVPGVGPANVSASRCAVGAEGAVGG